MQNCLPPNITPEYKPGNVSPLNKSNDAVVRPAQALHSQKGKMLLHFVMH